MKVATLDLTPELFVEFCKAAKNGAARRFMVKQNPLPDDAHIIRIGLADDGLWPQTLRLYIQSESFADTVEPPALPRIIFETIYDEA